MMYIIRAIPGACSDIVTSVIDSNGSFLTPRGSIKFINDVRRVLKTEVVDYDSLPISLEQASLKYKSISSQHHIENITIFEKYKLVSIEIDSEDLIDWCFTRLGKLYPYPNINFNKETLFKEALGHYEFTDCKLKLTDILKGNLIDKLDQHKIPYMDSELYYKWLAINTKRYPYNFV